ncbi:MAG: reverse transcriptase/maturase family protein [Candidatus Altimarinota bacterium]
MSIDLSLENIWRSWLAFRKGKHPSQELHEFQYDLEHNLFSLHQDLKEGTFRHRGYRSFIVCDNKRREVSVASVRDRVVHRLLYDYLNEIYDNTFLYDAWSCRKGKGLLAAIQRAQGFLKKYPSSFVWRVDVKKFFDSVDQKPLLKILSLRIKDIKALNLLREIIGSYTTLDRISGGGRGMPIGNLTSQIFANIYLNELDRFVKHELKAKAYLRYGDDFIIIDADRERLVQSRERVRVFLEDRLTLQLHGKNDLILRTDDGLKFLGMVLYPPGRRLNSRNRKRVLERLNIRNAGSYLGMVNQFEKKKYLKRFRWRFVHLLGAVISAW